MKARHKEQGERLHALGISFNSAASDIGIPRSTMNGYFSQGHIPPRRTDMPDKIDRYIKIKEAENRRGRIIRAAPLSGKFRQLGVSLDYIAADTGLARFAVQRGIYHGIWPDETTRARISEWIDRAIETMEGKRMITKITLPDEVQEYWGLDRDPFTNEMENAEDIFDARELARAEKKVMIAVDKNGWMALVGERGSGKTTLIKKVKGRLAKRKEVVLVEPRTVEKQFLSASHVCDAILHDLDADVIPRRGTLEHKARLVGHVLQQAFADGKKVVILIDEAHLLRDEMLLGLKRIYEIEVGFKKLLSIVLVGQSALARRLRANYELSEVSQRVDLHELHGLNGALGAYIEHKLARAGVNGGREIFDKSAIKAIGERADAPLSVNNLAAAALIAAHDLSEKRITSEIVKGI